MRGETGKLGASGLEFQDLKTKGSFDIVITPKRYLLRVTPYSKAKEGAGSGFRLSYPIPSHQLAPTPRLRGATP